MYCSFSLAALGQAQRAAPDFFVTQYAGSIGFVSGGLGYNIFKSKGMVSIHFGTVPKNLGGPLSIFTAKLFYNFWEVELSKRMTFRPVDVGLMVSYHTGDDFKSNVPDLFTSKNYYWWYTSMRWHLATETSLSVHLSPNRFFKKFTTYIELNSNDLYILSYITNASSLNLTRLIRAGLGARFNF